MAAMSIRDYNLNMLLVRIRVFKHLYLIFLCAYLYILSCPNVTMAYIGRRDKRKSLQHDVCC